MPRAPRFWGPRAYSFLYFFLNFLFPISARGPNSARPQRAQVPQKTRGPRNWDQTGFFFFPVLVFQRGAPKSLRKRYRPQNLNIEAPKCGHRMGVGLQAIFLFQTSNVPCFSAGSKQRGPHRVQDPQKRNLKLKKPRGPKVKKRQDSKSRPANKFFCSFFGQGAPKSDRARPENHRIQKISKFAANC
jgi:hypothetical protein